MFKSVSAPATISLLLATLLFAGSAQAQTAPQPRDQQKSCLASTANANGEAKEANMDGTYSACSLANGFIGIDVRANDGVGQTPEFSTPVSDQELRTFQSGDGTHRLATKPGAGGNPTIENHWPSSANDNSYRFATRDFVANEQFEPLDDARSYGLPGAAGRTALRSNSGDSEAPLTTSASLSDSAPQGSGVGSGGSGGGLNTTTNNLLPVTPNVPAVPEPETYAMLLVGLGLVALARKRKAAKA
ncbi:PEP-CTERM sorting domain-containing protein [Janthinobacterium aquaticum]|uniref:PEP-CTERM sorting domain-containing protein n=1 Tax=Janthinobacterium sp. FT58W TaxID=2654254 RepID=UPI001D018C25|nr:PEP-CTERM sorting domain-containing protein [Janthinobacterium sp. FT58W]